MEERLLTLSEMRKLTGVKSSKLRYLHETGKVIPARITDTGYRYYTQEQVMDILRETKQRLIVVYGAINLNKGFDKKYEEYIEKQLKEETEQLAEIVKQNIPDEQITPIYDLWTGSIENSNMMSLIKQAAKGLVIKIIVQDKKQFIPGDFNEFKKWLGYLTCELLDIEDLKQLEVDKDASKRD